MKHGEKKSAKKIVHGKCANKNTLSEVSVKLGTASGEGSEVKVDGVPLKGVRSITVHAEVDAITTVTVELIPDFVDVSAIGDVVRQCARLELPREHH